MGVVVTESLTTPAFPPIFPAVRENARAARARARPDPWRLAPSTTPARSTG